MVDNTQHRTPDASDKYLHGLFLQLFVHIYFVCVIIWHWTLKLSYISEVLLGGDDPVSPSLTAVKATDCEVLTMVWRNHKSSSRSENFKQIKYFLTSGCTLDDTMIPRTHRWCGYFNPVSLSTCFSDWRMHQQVLICATVIAPDHPQFLKKV